MTTKEFFKKMDDFEDNHPIICGFIKVLCTIGIMYCLIVLCYLVNYCM